MTYEEACQIAAQCWCDAETAHIEMDVRLAEAFARRLLRVRAEAMEMANAPLTSAAPELYEALERLVAVYQTSHSPVTRLSCWQQAGAALSKARGES